jgi:hypothetical protein
MEFKTVLFRSEEKKKKKEKKKIEEEKIKKPDKNIFEKNK